jgi:hypothetical protein
VTQDSCYTRVQIGSTTAALTMRWSRTLTHQRPEVVIHVERGWDPVEGPIELKSHAGRRKVPIAAVLRDHLSEHLACTRRRESDLIFGNTPESPFTANMLQRRRIEHGGRLASSG